MRIRLFTVDEANALLPQVRPRLERLVMQKRALEQLASRVAILSVATAGAAPANPDSLELTALAEKRRHLAEVIGRGVQELHEKGVMVKDLDKGLVDFYSLAGDRLIFLCWHLGETEVTHWHALDSGFRGRQPLKGAGLE